ncbi:MAG: hypothetical protein AAF193_11965, partial [Bacteroidota bacterium]
NAETGEIIIPVESEFKIHTNDEYLIWFDGTHRVVMSRTGDLIIRFEFTHYTDVSPVFPGLFQVHARRNNSWHYDGCGNAVRYR